jgi:hypothetical protein
MEPHELAELQAAYPQQARRALEQKWSFAAIADWLGRSELAGTKNLNALLYGYGMSSHALHLDWTGVSMIWERQTRSTQRIDAIDLAHGGRIVSDLLATSLLRVGSAYRVKGLTFEPIDEVRRSTDSLIAAIHDADEAWHQIEYSHDQ